MENFDENDKLIDVDENEKLNDVDEDVDIIDIHNSDDFDNVNEFENENLYENRDDRSSEHVNVLYLHQMYSSLDEAEIFFRAYSFKDGSSIEFHNTQKRVKRMKFMIGFMCVDIRKKNWLK